MLLRHLPPDARPREKLLSRGARALSDAELLALLLRTGVQGKNVLVLAQEIADRFGGMAGLLHADAQALQSIKGLGLAKRAELMAVLELARRALAQQLAAQPVFDQPNTLMDFVRLHIGNKPYEVFAVLFLDMQQKLIAWEEMFRGSLAEAKVYPRDVAVRALHHHAASVILAHNHPSGDLSISHADKTITTSLCAALGLLDIRVLDHVLVSPVGALSMAESGLL